MDTNIALIWLLLTTLLNGGQDLLDCVPTERYWQEKGVEITAELMIYELGDEAALLADPENRDKQIAQLIAQLGAAKFAEREAAQQMLASLGAEAEEPLRRAAAGDDPEITHRAGKLLEVLQRNQLEAIAEGRPLLAAGPHARTVRRLMAIRTCGERKFEAALPALRKLSESKLPFEPEYAARAIAAIEGKPYVAAQLDLPPRADDLRALPEETLGVMQFSTRPGAGLTRLMDGEPPPVKMPARRSRFFGPQLSDRVITACTRWVERAGPMQIGQVTVFVPQQIGGPGSWVGFICHGRFDREALARGVTDGRHRRVADVDVWSNAVKTMALLSDRQIVYFIHGEGTAPPVEALVNALKQGQPGGIEKNEPLQALLKTVDQKSPLWAALLINEQMQSAPLIAPIRNLTAQIQSDGDAETGFSLTVKAGGDDGELVEQTGRLMQAAFQGILIEARRRNAPDQRKMVALLLKSRFQIADGAAAVTLAAPDTQALLEQARAMFAGQLDEDAARGFFDSLP